MLKSVTLFVNNQVAIDIVRVHLVYSGCLRDGHPLSASEKQRQEQPILIVPRFNNNVHRRAFSVYGPLLWNSLPTEIRCENDFNTFKRNLKTYLFQSYFNA